MSAPFAGSTNGSPVPGYYPDPSIPGYIRYWNGSSWVPGTSRPAPGPGEPAPAPPADTGGAVPAARGGEPVPEQRYDQEEEDDHDEIDLGRASSSSAGSSLPEVRRRGEVAATGGEAEVADWDDPRRLHGNQPQSASAWQADPARQSGFGGDTQQPDLSWGSPPDSGAHSDAAPGPYEQTAGGADPRGGWGDSGAAQESTPDHTVGIRMPHPTTPEDGGAQGTGLPEPTVGLHRSDVYQYGTSGAADAGTEAPPHQGDRQPAPPQQYQPQQHQPQHQQQYGGHAQNPSAGQDTQRPPWEQQVHDLAQQAPGQAPAPHGHGVPHQQAHQPGPGFAGPGPGQEGAAPWRPPAANPFADAAQDARPAGLGKRLGARFVDGLVAYAVAAAVAFPFVGKATEHIQDKIDAVNQAGVTRTIWLVDGTTGVYLAIVLGAFLLFGLLYEALPTAKWGSTLGKKLFGVRVLDVERQDTPGTGAALRRWLTYSVLSLVVLGVVNVMWCLFDRPWRQCWHDKLARTFVADR